MKMLDLFFSGVSKEVVDDPEEPGLKKVVDLQDPLAILKNIQRESDRILSLDVFQKHHRLAERIKGDALAIEQIAESGDWKLLSSAMFALGNQVGFMSTSEFMNAGLTSLAGHASKASEKRIARLKRLTILADWFRDLPERERRQTPHYLAENYIDQIADHMKAANQRGWASERRLSGAIKEVIELEAHGWPSEDENYPC